MKHSLSRYIFFCLLAIVFVSPIVGAGLVPARPSAVSVGAGLVPARCDLYARPLNAADTVSITADSVPSLADSLRRMPLPQRIDNIVSKDPLLRRSQMAILVWDLDADTIVYDHGGLQLMRPASVIKLLTSVTALRNLGADYLFRTRLYARGQVADSILTDTLGNRRLWGRVLHGDLYVKGGFDPLFTHDDMYAFVRALKSRGIRSIKGNIYADLSFKDTLKWGEGWCWDDKEQTLTPLLYNGQGGFMSHFLRALSADTIAHPLHVFSGRAVGGDLQLWAERTHSIEQMLTHMLKASDNLWAESLFYQLGAADTMPYASARASAQKEYDLLLDLGLNPGDYSIADGSGLSLYNYLTPRAVVSLLRYSWHTPDILQTLLPCLPVMGKDGTLRRRLKNTRAQGNVCAKTGTLRHIATLAGYATTRKGAHLAFCIFNQGLKTSQEGRDFQDKICLALVR